MSIAQQLIVDSLTKTLEAEKAKLKLLEEAKVINENSKEPCRYFLKGNCGRGDKCPYFHDAVKAKLGLPEEAKVINKNNNARCRHFLKGYCRLGDKCEYLHDATKKRRRNRGGQPKDAANNPAISQGLDSNKVPLGISGEAKVINKNNKNPCCYIFKDTCRRGDNCPYFHEVSKEGFFFKERQNREETPQNGANMPATTQESIESKSTFDKVKEMWKNDPTSKLVIKCDGIEIETIKPLLAASSPVFKIMFETNMVEARESIIKIVDFKPEVVKKMVEFCENEKISDFEDLEEDVFKIAHKYQISDLMDSALQKMTKSTNLDNVFDRLKLAEFYDLKDFKKQCLQHGKF